MCGRMTQIRPASDYAALFRARLSPDLAWAPRYNLAPAQKALAVRISPDGGEREIWTPTWGLVPRWVREKGGYATINARIETVATRPAFRDSLRSRRCVVPADGYYEWQAMSGVKVPWYFREESGNPLALAGLWDSWRDPATGTFLNTFTVLVRPAASAIRPIHDRMPLLLAPGDREAWLDPASPPDPAFLERLAREEPAGLVWHPVSRAVSSSRNDGPELIRPLSSDSS